MYNSLHVLQDIFTFAFSFFLVTNAPKHLYRCTCRFIVYFMKKKKEEGKKEEEEEDDDDKEEEEREQDQEEETGKKNEKKNTKGKGRRRSRSMN